MNIRVENEVDCYIENALIVNNIKKKISKIDMSASLIEDNFLQQHNFSHAAYCVLIMLPSFILFLFCYFLPESFFSIYIDYIQLMICGAFYIGYRIYRSGFLLSNFILIIAAVTLKMFYDDSIFNSFLGFAYFYQTFICFFGLQISYKNAKYKIPFIADKTLMKRKEKEVELLKGKKHDYERELCKASKTLKDNLIRIINKNDVCEAIISIKGHKNHEINEIVSDFKLKKITNDEIVLKSKKMAKHFKHQTITT